MLFFYRNNAYIRDFPYPIGKDMKVFFPCMKVVAANSFLFFQAVYSKQARALFYCFFLRPLHTAF